MRKNNDDYFLKHQKYSPINDPYSSCVTRSAKATITANILKVTLVSLSIPKTWYANNKESINKTLSLPKRFLLRFTPELLCAFINLKNI